MNKLNIVCINSDGSNLIVRLSILGELKDMTDIYNCLKPADCIKGKISWGADHSKTFPDSIYIFFSFFLMWQTKAMVYSLFFHKTYRRRYIYSCSGHASVLKASIQYGPFTVWANSIMYISWTDLMLKCKAKIPADSTFFFLFLETRLWDFMQIVSRRDNLHIMSKLFLG